MISHFPKNFSITTICGRTEDEDERVEEAEEAEEVYLIHLYFSCVCFAFWMFFSMRYFDVTSLNRNFSLSTVIEVPSPGTFDPQMCLFGSKYLSRWWFRLTATAPP